MLINNDDCITNVAYFIITMIHDASNNFLYILDIFIMINTVQPVLPIDPPNFKCFVGVSQFLAFLFAYSWFEKGCIISSMIHFF